MLSDVDRKWVAGILADEPEALRQFDAYFRRRIESFLLRRGLRHPDSEDVTQDILIEALRQMCKGQFRGEASLATWMHQLMRGKAEDFRRKHRNRPSVSLTEVLPDDPRLATQSNVEEVVAVGEALARMPVAEQFALVLHERDGRTLEEMGQILRLKKSAVGARVQRARASFRVALRATGTTPDRKRLKD
jgi:RNA polymerase sigma-70 factor (ECF subfamily)